MLFRTADVTTMAGVSKRQLQYWDERGVLVPHSKKDHQRLYTAQQVKDATRLGYACSSGLPLKRVKRTLKSQWSGVLKIYPGQSFVVGETLVMAVRGKP